MRNFGQWEAAGPPPKQLDIILNSVMLVCLVFFASEVISERRGSPRADARFISACALQTLA